MIERVVSSSWREPSVEATTQTRLSIVVPCYNEQEVLPETVHRLCECLGRLTEAGKIAAGSELIFVDDGSRDATWALIRASHEKDPRVRGIRLSANRGHQTALIAGLFAADGDAIASIDADLQDDVTAIDAMLDAYQGGSDIVYGVRRKRTSDSFFKRWTAESYYRLLALLGVRVVHNHADFRLLSRRALDALRQYQEVNLFLRGIVPLIGYPSSVVYYDRAERYAGTSKYPVRRMIALALDGVTSFTALPLRLIAVLGFAVSLLSMLLMLWAFWAKLFTSKALPGWTSSVVPIYFMGGIQLFSLGVIGEYVAKLYGEAKRRPRYFVQDTL